MTDDASVVLGRTGIVGGRITVGTSVLGRGTTPGSVAEQDAVDLAVAILDGPFPLIDTSNIYADGRSEAVLGLASRRGAGPGRTIITKTDRDVPTGRFDADRVVRSFEESAERLGVERIPLLHLHDPYTIGFDEARGPGGAIAGMLSLKERGLVDAIGIAAGRVSVVRPYVESGEFDALLTHNRHTLVDRSAVPLMEAAHEKGMGVFNAAPFGGDLLSRGARDGASYFYRPASAELLEWTRRAAQVCSDHGVSLPAAALHFSLRSPLVHSTVVGVSRPERLHELVALRDTVVPETLWAALGAIGPAPTPIED
ncbi:aldo/keto reductase [Microbacterium tumbae]